MSDQRGALSTYRPTPAPRGPGVPRPIERPTLSQMWQAGTDLARADLPSADRDRLYDAYQPVLDELNRGRSWFRRFHNPFAGGANLETFLFDDGGNLVTAAPSAEAQEAHLWAAIGDRRQVDPKAFPGLPATREALHDQVLAAAKGRFHAARDTLARNDRWLGTGAQIGAGIATSVRDPINIAALPLGGVGRSLATRVLTAGLANMAVEAAEQPIVASQRAQIGETLTPEEAAINVTAAGLFGSGLHAVGEGVVAPVARAAARTDLGQAAIGGAANLYAAGRALAAAARARIGWPHMTAEERAAARALERQADIAATSPFTPGPGTDAHVARIEATARGLAAGEGAPPIAVPPFHFQSWTNRVGVVESGGRWQVEAPTSSAYGFYQITRPTFLRVAKGLPGFEHMTDAALWNRRTNPGAQEAVFTALTREYRAALARAGAPESFGNLYLMHFAGTGGGTKILKAAADTPIERLLSERAIAANAWLRGKTAGDLVAWSHARMGERPHDGPVLSREGFGDDAAGDAEWRQAQAEVDAAERELAVARAAAVRESAPPAEEAAPHTIEDDPIPFDLDDPRNRDVSGRDPFADLPEEMAGAEAVGADWEPHPDGPMDAGNRFAAEALRLEARGEGELPAALDHPEIGTIDVKWGYAGNAAKNYAGGYGLSHILAKHPEVRDELPNLPEIIRGMEIESDDGRTIRLRDDRYRAGVRLDWDGREERWLVTAYEVGRRTPAAPVSTRDAAGDRASPGRGAEDDMGHVEAGDKPGTALVPAPIGGFDSVEDAGAARLLDSLEHDLRMLMAAEPDLSVRLDAEGPDRLLSDVMDELDGDEAAIAAARACLTPPRPGGEG